LKFYFVGKIHAYGRWHHYQFINVVHDAMSIFSNIANNTLQKFTLFSYNKEGVLLKKKLLQNIQVRGVATSLMNLFGHHSS